MTTTSGPKRDRRVQRTERLLHEALSALIRDKPYDSIAVKEILHRADVGRSTFYAHFRDKDELLISGIRELLGSAQLENRQRDLLWFSRPFFEHLDQHRRGSDRTGVAGQQVVHERLEQIVADLVAAELKREARSAQAAGAIPPDLLARHVASTFVLVLNWWMETDGPMTASEVDDHFRTLVGSVVKVQPECRTPR